MEWSGQVEPRLRGIKIPTMQPNVEYQARISGYYDSGGVFQNLPTPPLASHYVAPETFWFEINSSGQYRVALRHADPTSGAAITTRYPSSPNYCNAAPTPPKLDYDLILLCDIEIGELRWTPPVSVGLPNPDMRVAIVNDNTDDVIRFWRIAQVDSSRPLFWLPFVHPVPGELDIEGMMMDNTLDPNIPYRLDIMGYYDSGGTFTGLSRVAGSGPTFTILNHRDGPGFYYMRVGPNRYLPANNQPSQPCNPNPCLNPPCSSECSASQPTDPGLPSPTHIDLPTDLDTVRYGSYPGNIQNRWIHGRNYNVLGSTPPYGSYLDVPTANMPGNLVPDSRNPVETDLNTTPNRFNYDFKDGHRDSVAEYYGNPYRPVTHFAWNQPPDSTTGVGYTVSRPSAGAQSSGWHDTWELTLTPTKLEQYNSGTPQLVNSSVTGGFRPPQVTGPDINHRITTNRQLTHDNNQTDHLVPYRWHFDWEIKGTHEHRASYDSYTLEVYRAIIQKHWVRTVARPWSYDYDHTHTATLWNPNPQEHNHSDSGVDYPIVDGGFEAAYESTIWPGGMPTGSTRRPGISSWYTTNQVLEWIYEHDLREYPTITRTSEYEGQSYNCSWLLIVRKPSCIVYRRFFNLSVGRSNQDDSGALYEIFPPGLETSFSRMEVSSYNKFELDPTIRFVINPHIGQWTPKRHSPNGQTLATVSTIPRILTSPDPVAPGHHNAPAVTIYREDELSLDWPGEYRVRWHLAWTSDANGNWPNGADISTSRNPTTTWQGPERSDSLWCGQPTIGLQIFVSAKPPTCRVESTTFEFKDPEARLKIALKNPENYVTLVIQSNNPTHYRSYRLTQLGVPVLGTLGYSNGLASHSEPGNPATTGPHWTLPEGRGPGASLTPLDLISDDNLVQPNMIPLGKYEYDWTIRARRGIEVWSTTGAGIGHKEPAAWWDDPDEQIVQASNRNDCEQKLYIVRIPFFKAFLGGMAAGGRFGLGSDFYSCGSTQITNWIRHPTEAQGAWGHSANKADSDALLDSLTNAIGASVEYSLEAQNRVGGIYSSSSTNQTVDLPTSLTFANNRGTPFGGESVNIIGDSGWRCIPNYWQKPDGLTPNWSSDRLDATNEVHDGTVIYRQGDLTIDGDFRGHKLGADGNPIVPLVDDEEIRTTIFVEGDVYIKDNILNASSNPSDRYYGFSDMGLIQIIARGNILIDPTVTRIEAMLVAYPNTNGSGGGIDLCASPDSDPLSHYRACDTNRLRIYGALVAQRIYFSRITGTLNNEPTQATPANTVASEIIILNPSYQLVSPAALVFGNWTKNPEAIFDIPTSL